MIRTRLSLLLAFSIISTYTHAQKSRTLQPVLELQMPEGSGSNGASVVWHPVEKKYYAAFAGNIEYPMAVFSEEGTRLSADGLATGADVRGLWYDTKQEAVCGNAYAEGGWFVLILDDKGIPQSSENIVDEMMQPEENSVGLMVTEDEAVCFLQGQELKIYTGKDSNKESYRIYAGQKIKPKVESENDGGSIPEAYNSNVAVYTEQERAELGLLNVSEKRIELYDKKNGLMTQILKLPEDAPANEMFNFACANGIYWLFDKESRKWIGYK